ncbi:MAG: ABC transporter permease [Anaerolineae bacterium]|nr:ABC transporter permease [Anaerolineae bacterium]
MPTTPRPSLFQGLGRLFVSTPELGVTVAIIIFFSMFTALDKSMATPDGIVLLFTQVVYMGVAAFGMSHLMLAGEIDLSTGSVAGLAAAVSAVVIVNMGMPEWVGIAAALLAAVLVGLLNSLVVLKIGVPSFFGTLGTHFFVLGVTQAILKGEWIFIEDKIPFLTGLASPSPLFNLPWMFIVYVLAVLAAEFLIRRSKVGAILSATGGNRRAADVAGINTTMVKTACFVLVAVCSAIGGLLVMKAGTAADQQIGDGWQLWVIAIAVIGGSSFSGGLGSIIGGFLGAILIQIIKLGLGAAQIKTNAQGVVIGAILIASAILDVIRRRIKYY